MKHHEWLQGELLLWQKEGIIDSALADKISLRYSSPKERISVGAIIIGSFGALLVGLGIIALFAANWDCFNRPERAAIAMAPVAICTAIALLGFCKNYSSANFREILTILWSISIGAAMCLVAQTYQVGGSASGLLLLVMLLTLPIIWLMRSNIVGALWAIYPVVWTSLRCYNDHAPREITVLFGMALFALAIPMYIRFIRRNTSRKALLTMQLVTGLIYPIGLSCMLFGLFEQSIDYPGAVLLFSLVAAVFAAIAFIGKLPVWTTCCLLIVFAMSMPSPFLREGYLVYFASLALAAVVTTFGIIKSQLSRINIGVYMLLWLILGKFFESRVSFTAKGIAFVASGLLLLAINIIFARMKKNGGR